MKRLTDIFDEHKKAMLKALADEIKGRGGVIKVKAIIGGKDQQGFDRKTILTRVTLENSLFDDPRIIVIAHDKKYPNVKIEQSLDSFQLDTLETICWACDECNKKGDDDGE